jgi:succinyl-diaminopimelate desuccinylase
MPLIDALELSQELIRCPSVTPEDAGAITALTLPLEKLGFTCHRLTFSDKASRDVTNLYARLGTRGKNLCFAGHTDVVPVGDRAAWLCNPFEARVTKGILIGRGASDMKTAIAAWAAACSRYLKKHPRPKGSLSFLITGDEEGLAVNGTVKVLKWLKDKKETLDACIVGEPTSQKRVGDTVKIGRRGSMTFFLTLHGQQGHVAYPHLSKNPVTDMVNILGALKSKPLDKGTEHFQPSNLEVVTVDVGNPSWNVIPATAKATMNIRYNDHRSWKELKALVEKTIKAHTKLKFDLELKVSSEPFLSKPGPLSALVVKSVKSVTKKTPELSTSGGSSDARFIKHYCPVVEVGLSNQTAHKVNEQVAVKDIETLSLIYEAIITNYFA